MLSSLLGLVIGIAVLSAVYFVRHQQATNPALRFPKIAEALHLKHDPAVPSLEGAHEGRAVSVVDLKGQAKIALKLKTRSRLRVEVGPRELVTKRAGIIVPDPVPTGDAEFDERFLVRCSDKAAGERLLDQDMRRRLSAQAAVDLVGQDDKVQWTVPLVNDAEVLDEIFSCMTAVAAEMESYPA